jgi:hypothetical protein
MGGGEVKENLVIVETTPNRKINKDCSYSGASIQRTRV